MTIRIDGEAGRASRLTLTCDGGHLFPAAATFDHPDGFIAQHREAMAAGWKETFDRRGRVFLGPCCSGKV